MPVAKTRACSISMSESPVSRSTKNSAWNEVVAIILLGVGTLLFLALISYNPKDLPSWVPWSYLSPPNKPAQNFIGPLGAILASFCYLTLGAASYFLAGMLLFFRGATIILTKMRLIARPPGIFLVLANRARLLPPLRRPPPPLPRSIY